MNYIVNDESDYTEEAYIINDIVKNVINEFDYSNILPTNDYIFFLVQYLEMVCNKYLKLINDDEEKNKKVKYEFRDYKYGKMYSETELRVLIYDKGFECIKCSDFKSYKHCIRFSKLALGCILAYKSLSVVSILKRYLSAPAFL